MKHTHLLRKNVRGISLIELLVVLAILAILLNMAVPAFGGYMIKAKRHDATSMLYEMAQRLERCFTLEGVYNGACTLRSISNDGHYSLNAIRNEQDYSLFAIPISGGSQANDNECATFSITSTGEKNATGTLGKKCW